MSSYGEVIGEYCIRVKEILEKGDKQSEVCKLSLLKVLDLSIPIGENLKIKGKVMTITGKSSNYYELVDGENYYRLTNAGLNEIECDKDFPRIMYYPMGMLFAEVSL